MFINFQPDYSSKISHSEIGKTTSFYHLEVYIMNLVEHDILQCQYISTKHFILEKPFHYMKYYNVNVFYPNPLFWNSPSIT